MCWREQKREVRKKWPARKREREQGAALATRRWGRGVWETHAPGPLLPWPRPQAIQLGGPHHGLPPGRVEKASASTGCSREGRKREGENGLSGRPMQAAGRTVPTRCTPLGPRGPPGTRAAGTLTLGQDMRAGGGGWRTRPRHARGGGAWEKRRKAERQRGATSGVRPSSPRGRHACMPPSPALHPG